MTDKKDDAAPEPADVPPTRKHEAVTEPPTRESHLSLDKIPLPAIKPPVQIVYVLLGLAVAAMVLDWLLGLPAELSGAARGFAGLAITIAMLCWLARAPRLEDDGAVARVVRSIDHYLGIIEQAILFFLLAAVVLTAASAALSDKIFGHHIGRWWFTTVRGGTFAIAMFGAVFATHQQRHLAMDLVSRRLPPKARLVLGIVLKLFMIGIAAILFRSGMHQRDTVGGVGEDFVSDKQVVTALPIGAALIMLHALLHVVIDVEYLVRGKNPAEKMRTGH